MSAFIGYNNANPDIEQTIQVGFNQNDDSVQAADYRVSPPYMAAWMNQLRDTDILWTRSAFAGSMSDAEGASRAFDCFRQYWEWCWPPTGCHVPKVVSGVVKDASGAPVPGATVLLFNTATGLLVDTVTSQADGSYRAGDPNAVTCFAVADLPGSPETAGTTIQELTGL